MVSIDDVWNTIPLFILFREAIEASIIVSVLISFCRRMNATQLEKQVWWGVGLGIVISIVFGIIFICLYYLASQSLFTGSNQLYFKASVSWIAAFMILILAFAMLRFMGWEEKWKRRLEAMAAEQAVFDEAQKRAREEKEAALTGKGLDRIDSSASNSNSNSNSIEESSSLKRKQWYDPRGWFCPSAPSESDAEKGVKDPAAGSSWTTRNAFFIAIFLTVIREGLESVIFLAGVGNAKPTAIILPGIVGLICGCAVGFVLYYTGKTVRHIKWLLIVMALVLFFISAGQFETGANYLLKAGAFGTYYAGPLTAPKSHITKFGDGDEFYFAPDNEDGYRPVDVRPWWMIPLWDISYCCSDKDEGNKFLALSKAVVGYNSQPTWVDVVAYCGFWILIIALACWKFYKRTLFDADYKHNKMLREKAEAEERAQAWEKLGGGKENPKV